MFHPIDREHWDRRAYFDHYFTQSPCTYSMTVELDASRLWAASRRSGAKFHPVLIYCIARTVNRHREFRMGLDAQGNVGVYDRVDPSYTVFHKELESFSTLWTPYDPSFPAFYRSYQADLEAYGGVEGVCPKPEASGSLFPISCIPWSGFTGFNLNLQKGYDYLPPIFTVGGLTEKEGRKVLPLAVQVHHAVCDGFHTARLLNELQELMNGLHLPPVGP